MVANRLTIIAGPTANDRRGIDGHFWIAETHAHNESFVSRPTHSAG
jgi:hypothetical protein